MQTQKNTKSLSINCKGLLYDLSTPKIMGIINCTPDSFYEKSRITEIDKIRKKVILLILAEYQQDRGQFFQVLKKKETG
jgi:hypothetical protein